MKPSTQTNKAGSSNSKIKKTAKDREKRKSQGGTTEINNHNATEKGSPTKESSARLYAGIDADSLINYAEQTNAEHLSEEITNTLTEDINYRLRYIINDSLLKARLSGRNAISTNDLEQTFENLRIERAYGAPTNPNWVQFSDQNLFCLDDKQVNLVEMAEEENVYYQHAEAILSSKWIPELQEISKALKNYFTTMCQMIVSSDVEVRKMALTNIAEITGETNFTKTFKVDDYKRSVETDLQRFGDLVPKGPFKRIRHFEIVTKNGRSLPKLCSPHCHDREQSRNRRHTKHSRTQHYSILEQSSGTSRLTIHLFHIGIVLHFV
jgi:hypothetical protein